MPPKVTKPQKPDSAVPVRRAPVPLARRFLQICTTATAEVLAEDSLTPLQFGTLVYLSRVTGEPDIDQNGLAARLGIVPANTSQIVEELEKRDLLSRRINGADKRARLLRLTERGERLLARLDPVLRARQMRVLAALTVKQRELLLDLLAKVVESNRPLARPGAGRRKRGFRESSVGKGRAFSQQPG